MSGVGFLDSVKLHSAREGGHGARAANVEQCTCPDGYVGQFCESCAPGYRRDPPGTSPLSRCIPCNCNQHSDACDVTTGALARRDVATGWTRVIDVDRIIITRPTPIGCCVFACCQLWAIYSCAVSIPEVSII